ncbi:hypothetical protein K440DRAFT_324341 [Wilcoxina mikolae CBS 423.85]|nr:hypothetical protein K440DRAFT_324341 [Wilcoxina mikolae CBS 423.85]
MSPSAISLGSYDMLGFDDSDNGVKTHTPGGTQKKRKISGGSAEQSGSGSNDQSPDGDEYDSSDQHPLGGGGGGGRRKRGGAGGSGLPFVKRYACPYFKYNPDQYRRCGNWSCSLSEKHRVRSHVFRTHLKPEECLFGCGYRAGQPHQMRAHFEAGCKQDTRPVSSDMDTEQKAQRLMRGFSWQQIYACLFDCDVDRVPDPCTCNSPSPLFLYLGLT